MDTEASCTYCNLNISAQKLLGHWKVLFRTHNLVIDKLATKP